MSVARVGALLLVLAPLPVGAVAQTGSVAGVLRSVRDEPIADALVFVDDGARSTLTDALGAFRLDGIAPGTHVLSYRRMGYAPRSFNLTIPADGGSQDVGQIVLREGPAPAATLTGRVTDSAAGQPVAGAVVRMNGNAVAQTDSAGAFQVAGVPVQWGPNVVTIASAFEEATAADSIWVSDDAETLDLTVALDVSPIALPGVAAEATPTRSPRLEARGFYERMENNRQGIYWTSVDIIERDPGDWSDLLRGVRFPRTRAAGSFGNTQTGICGRTAEPLAFLDGAHIGDIYALVEAVRVEMIEGMEIYRGIAGLPVEFNLLGAECGVIVVWTRQGRPLNPGR